MNWVIPIALGQVVTPDSPGEIVAGIKVVYNEPGQVDGILRSVETRAMQRANVVDLDKPWLFFLRVVMPCGSVVLFKTADDIPRTNAPCLCGDPRHFFVLYVMSETVVATSPVWP